MEHDPTNGSNDLGPAGTPADERTVPNIPQVSPDGSSRRNFLKAAVVASAAVAAAGGAAGVALISGGKTPSLIRLADFNCTNTDPSGPGQCSGNDPCYACITNSTPNGQLTVTQGTATVPGFGSGSNASLNSLYFWVTDSTAIVGDYYALTVSVDGNLISPSSSPFELHNGADAITESSATTGWQSCPTSNEYGSKNNRQNGSSYSSDTDFSNTLTYNSTTYHTTTPYQSSTSVLQFALHLEQNGTTPNPIVGTHVFTFTLFQSTSSSGPWTPVCNSDTYTFVVQSS